MTCPCGRGAELGVCCGPYLDGSAQPPTAEALMRARYTAYTRADVDFILATHELPRGAPVDRAAVERWARESEWLGLEVVAVEAGGEDDDRGIVEFIARYRAGEVARSLHERSRFARVAGHWMYLDGDTIKPPPVVRGEKIGRNQPCPCGNGKKYKHCHGAGK
jgi:SEC-C motif domain protein